MKTLLPSIRRAVQACGYMMVQGLMAAGCAPPDWAEPLNPEETQLFSGTLDEAEDQLDFVQDLAAQGRDTFVLDNDTPTPEALRTELEDTIKKGREMLANGQVYIVHADQFPADDDVEHADAFSHITPLDTSEYMVFLEKAIQQERVDIVMHELGHIVANSGHVDEIYEETGYSPEVADSTMISQPNMDTVIDTEDVAYRNTYYFGTTWSLEDYVDFYGQDVSVSLQSYDAPYEDYAKQYEALVDYTKSIDADSAQWATVFVDCQMYNQNTNDSVFVTNRTISSGWEWLSSGLSGLELEHDDLVTLLALPSSEFIRADAKQGALDGLQSLRDRYPEYAQQYTREHLRETTLPYRRLR